MMLSTYDFHGGAAKASFRLFKELKKKKGVDILMYVQKRESDDKQVVLSYGFWNYIKSRLTPFVEVLPRILFPSKKKVWQSFALYSSFDIRVVSDFKPDLIHINWTGNGFMKPEDIESLKDFKVVWTFYDMWPLLGSEHFESMNHSIVEKYLVKRKKAIWENCNFSIVTLSRWLTKLVGKSYAFKGKQVNTINPGLDTKIFNPTIKIKARNFFKLPIDKKIILFGAYKADRDERKGKKYLIEALKKVRTKLLKQKRDLCLITFGYEGKGFFVEEGIEVVNFGIIKDEKLLAMLYSAADLTVVPSIQESFGQVAAESFSCGTPVVAFNTSGLRDIVDHKVTGYLAKCFSSIDLALGIMYIFNLKNYQIKKMQMKCRKMALKKFSLKKYVDSYYNLFNKVLKINDSN